MSATVRLRKPLERAIRAGHPWIYRDAINTEELPIGEPVTVLDRRGRHLGIGLVEAGPIAVRVFSTHPKDRFDAALLRSRIQAALALRDQVMPPHTNAYRWLHGEGDGLPGVVCDRYGVHAVLKLDGEAILRHRELLASVLAELLPERGIAGALVRASRHSGVETELLFGDAPPHELAVREHGMTLLTDLWSGQKTGLFLDHRESRARIRSLTRGRSVLNLYGYTGGFSVAAGLGGAVHVTTVDSAKPAIELALRTFERNRLDAAQHTAIVQDVPEFLRHAEASAARFDLIVADPPNFAPNSKSVEPALESYQKLHAACCTLAEQGGLYLAASCSSHVTPAVFLDTLREGARRARRMLTVLEQTRAPADHPRRLAFPEGDYLKIVLCRVE